MAIIAAFRAPSYHVRRMFDQSQSAPRPRKRLLCGALSCGGCVTECGVVLYKYLAGLDDFDKEEIVDPLVAEIDLDSQIRRIPDQNS